MRTAVAPHELLPEGLHLESMSIDAGRVSISVSSGSRRSRCPLCGRDSSRVHSRYSRTVSDLAWHGASVEFEVRARRFFCDEASCGRRIFCERLTDVAACARKTDRLEEALLTIVVELGGRAGARLAEELGLVVGRDALLRRAKSAPLPDGGKVRVLGVDDFAFRCGTRYGTILVDLERRKVVDLLPERSQESLVDWLKRHPGVETATRDRSNIYREALAKGAPDATQIADRWHLMHNLADALEEFLLQERKMLREAARTEARSPEEGDDAASVSPGPLTNHRPRIWYERQLESSRKLHERLVEQWRDIRGLHLAGADIYDIARKLGVSRSTVYRYREREEPPEPTRFRHKKRVLDPYVPYVLKRWGEGCRNGRKLYREIRERGYAHDTSNLGRLLAELRRAEAAGKPGGKPAGRPPPGAVHPDTPTVPTACQAAALFLRREEKLTAEQKAYLDRLWAPDETSADAYRLTQGFAWMVRGLEGEKLDE
jgi:transposase